MAGLWKIADKVWPPLQNLALHLALKKMKFQTSKPLELPMFKPETVCECRSPRFL